MSVITKTRAAAAVAGLMAQAQKLAAVAEEMTSSIDVLCQVVQNMKDDQVPAVAYSQRDTAWSNLILGNGTLTIGQAGCLMCAIASACGLDPAKMNQWLRENNGYASGNLFVFASIFPLGWYFEKLVDCPTPESTPIQLIRESLLSGGLVVAKVDSDLSAPGVQEHWIRILSVTDDGQDATIIDPWLAPGSVRVDTIKRFGDTLALALWRVAFYHHV